MQIAVCMCYKKVHEEMPLSVLISECECDRSLSAENKVLHLLVHHSVILSFELIIQIIIVSM